MKGVDKVTTKERKAVNVVITESLDRDMEIVRKEMERLEMPADMYGGRPSNSSVIKYALQIAARAIKGNSNWSGRSK